MSDGSTPSSPVPAPSVGVVAPPVAPPRLAAAHRSLRQRCPNRGQLLRGAARDGADEEVEAGVGRVPGGAEAEILVDHDFGETRAGWTRLDQSDGRGEGVRRDVEGGARREPAEDLRELTVSAGHAGANGRFGGGREPGARGGGAETGAPRSRGLICWEVEDPRDAEPFVRDATNRRARDGMIGNDLAQKGARLERTGEELLGRKPGAVRGRHESHVRCRGLKLKSA